MPSPNLLSPSRVHLGCWVPKICLSGCGIIPKILPVRSHIPAIFSIEPFGLKGLDNGFFDENFFDRKLEGKKEGKYPKKRSFSVFLFQKEIINKNYFRFKFDFFNCWRVDHCFDFPDLGPFLESLQAGAGRGGSKNGQKDGRD